MDSTPASEVLFHKVGPPVGACPEDAVPFEVASQLHSEIGQAFELRRMTPADRPSLVAMYNDFEPKAAAAGLPPRSHPEFWLDQLAGYPNFVVEAGGILIGHAVLCPQHESAEVAVFVHQSARNRGLGKVLLSELVKEARRLGLRRIWGFTEADNVPMLRLARSLGFMQGEEPGEFCLFLDEPCDVNEPRPAA
jgi:L-amino acid N-acyltransferase YncA